MAKIDTARFERHVADRVLIQVNEDGEFPNSAIYTAAQGFELRGREVVRMTPEEIGGRKACPEDLVFGGVNVVRGYLAKMDCEPPNLDYPKRLRSFLQRTFEITTLGEIRGRYNDEGPPVFIKPIDQKVFTGHVVQRFRDLLETVSFDKDLPIYVVECVKFVSEWRFYCYDDEIVGVGHYLGDPLQFPDQKTITEAAIAFADQKDSPIAYGLDFGITQDGDTQLVEVNDMFSLGCYGLKPERYSFLIDSRWDQMVAGALP